MLNQTFGLFFYLKKRNNLSSGPASIYLHITVMANVLNYPVSVPTQTLKSAYLPPDA